jgi:putative colanic acid biosynthesis acetyltransferase WcaF
MGMHSTLGPHVNCYNQGMITIGDGVVISQGAFLCTGTHDYDSKHFQLVTRPIHIGNQCWLAADCFVGPGSTIEEGVVLGARAVVHGHLSAWQVYAGNPAQIIKPRRRHSEAVHTATV